MCTYGCETWLVHGVLFKLVRSGAEKFRLSFGASLSIVYFSFCRCHDARIRLFGVDTPPILRPEYRVS